MKGRKILGVALALAVLAALLFAFGGGWAGRSNTNLPHALDTTE